MKSRFRSRLYLSLFMFVLCGAVFRAAAAATLCTDLPPSTLQVYDIKAAGFDEALVSARELNRPDLPDDLISRHAQMLSLTDFVTWFDIVHRIVSRDDGSVCDAPSLVRIGFGATRRVALFERDAAENPCLRQHMLDHEAAHAGAFNETIDRFIDEHRTIFQRGMVTLKQTPAPNADVARARWESRLRLILTEAKEQLLAEIRAASARIDAPLAVADLEKACGGISRSEP